MDVFDIHRQVIDDYRAFTGGFVEVLDDRSQRLRIEQLVRERGRNDVAAADCEHESGNRVDGLDAPDELSLAPRNAVARVQIRGAYKRREPGFHAAQVAELRINAAAGVPTTVLAKEFRIGRAAVYSYLSTGAPERDR